MKLKKMTWEQHIEYGKKIKEMRNLTLEMVEQFGRVYEKTDKINKCAKKLEDAIDSLKNNLDNKVCAEYPEKRDHEVTRIYYGEEK